MCRLARCTLKSAATLQRASDREHLGAMGRTDERVSSFHRRLRLCISAGRGFAGCTLILSLGRLLRLVCVFRVPPPTIVNQFHAAVAVCLAIFSFRDHFRVSTFADPVTYPRDNPITRFVFNPSICLVILF